MDVESNYTIHHIKELIADRDEGYKSFDRIGITIHDQEYDTNSKRYLLYDDRTLSDYNIGKETTLHLIITRPPDSFYLNRRPSISPFMINWNAYNDPTISQFNCFYSDSMYKLVINWLYGETLPEDITKIIILNLQFMQHRRDQYHNNQFIQSLDLNGLPKRIMKEIQKIPKQILPNIIIRLHPENYRHFLIEIKGPKDTSYEGGIFYVEMFLNDKYPMKPPKILFLTPIIHPNVYPERRVFLPILRYKWTPALNIFKIALIIQDLLNDIEPEDWECAIPDFDIRKAAKDATLKYSIMM